MQRNDCLHEVADSQPQPLCGRHQKQAVVQAVVLGSGETLALGSSPDTGIGMTFGANGSMPWVTYPPFSTPRTAFQV